MSSLDFLTISGVVVEQMRSRLILGKQSRYQSVLVECLGFVSRSVYNYFDLFLVYLTSSLVNIVIVLNRNYYK